MTESDCLFCKIIADEIPADIIHESPDAIAFRDIKTRMQSASSFLQHGILPGRKGLLKMATGSR